MIEIDRIVRLGSTKSAGAQRGSILSSLAMRTAQQSGMARMALRALASMCWIDAEYSTGSGECEL